MAVNEWKIWKRFRKDPYQEEKQTDLPGELKAVLEFLRDTDLKEMIREMEKMKELAEEEGLVDGEIIEKNLREQIRLFDKILQRYDFFQNDADINGLRLKKAAGELLRKAEKHQMEELVKEKKKKLNWRE